MYVIAESTTYDSHPASAHAEVAITVVGDLNDRPGRSSLLARIKVDFYIFRADGNIRNNNGTI